MKLLKHALAMLVAAGWLLSVNRCWAQDPFVGEYEGTYQADASQKTKATGKVIAEGPNYYRVVVQAEPLRPGEPTAQFEIYGVQQGTRVNLFGRANAQQWHGRITGDQLTTDPGYYGIGVELKKTTRTSPTQGAQPPADAVVLLPFAPDKAPDASAWKGGSWKPQEDGSLQCDPGKGSILTKRSFGDMKLHLEFWLPLMAESFGQAVPTAVSSLITSTKSRCSTPSAWCHPWATAARFIARPAPRSMPAFRQNAGRL